MTLDQKLATKKFRLAKMQTRRQKGVKNASMIRRLAYEIAVIEKELGLEVSTLDILNNVSGHVD